MDKPRLEMMIAALRNYSDSVKRLVLPEGKSPDKFEFDFSTFGRLEPTCHTAACALGMAAMLPEFREQGLGYRVLLGSIHIELENCDKGSFGSAAKFFDITEDEVEELFDPLHYYNGSATAPYEIADNIEEFIRCKESGELFVTEVRRREDEEDEVMPCEHGVPEDMTCHLCDDESRARLDVE